MPGQDKSEVVKPDSKPVAEKVIRVAVVEDDSFIRQRVSEGIVSTPDFSLVCSCRSAEEALEQLPGSPDAVSELRSVGEVPAQQRAQKPAGEELRQLQAVANTGGDQAAGCIHAADARWATALLPGSSGRAHAPVCWT